MTLLSQSNINIEKKKGFDRSLNSAVLLVCLISCQHKYYPWELCISDNEHLRQWFTSDIRFHAIKNTGTLHGWTQSPLISHRDSVITGLPHDLPTWLQQGSAPRTSETLALGAGRYKRASNLTNLQQVYVCPKIKQDMMWNMTWQWHAKVDLKTWSSTKKTKHILQPYFKIKIGKTSRRKLLNWWLYSIIIITSHLSYRHSHINVPNVRYET